MLPWASGHVRSRGQSINGATHQLSAMEKTLLYVTVHASALALSSIEKSFYGLWALLQPSVSVPQTPCLQVQPFVLNILHIEWSGQSSIIFFQSDISEY